MVFIAKCQKRSVNRVWCKIFINENNAGISLNSFVLLIINRPLLFSYGFNVYRENIVIVDRKNCRL